MNKLILAGVVALSATACAYNQAPVVDMAGVSPQQYNQDLAYCESYAEQVDKSEAASVGAQNGAAVGASVGAVGGAIEDGVEGAVGGAIVGALLFGLSGATEESVKATEVQARVLRNCLIDKGYNVYDREV